MGDKVNNTVTVDNSSLVSVDIGRLGESLQTVFSGIAGVFGTIGATAAAEMIGAAGITDPGAEGKRTSKVRKADMETAENGKGKKGNDAGKAAQGGAGDKDGTAGKEAGGKPEGADVGVLDADHAGVAGNADAGSDSSVKTEKRSAVAEAAAEDTAETATETAVDEAATEASEQKTESSVTAEDITKVIVAKIKQDRANSQKIGAVLKTYGAEKVSALKPGQYEAFLTDISQL